MVQILMLTKLTLMKQWLVLLLIKDMKEKFIKKSAIFTRGLSNMAKFNMAMKKNEMPAQDPNVRNKNFLEVALGYTPEQAIDEAKRCLQCKHRPCVGGCPVGIDIPGFIKETSEG